ncbi:serine hydrolase [Bacillus sp. V3-13]|uniref:serine hydrolase domain-containing protein n=1 Tax=Bacillus sp. V3-13 TaxID=2053728 RepID=UPI000C78A75E|nr:serine hydrolase domain-containing protein [Bacillus sp. V3-13]PLR78434.1 serine hydrolase [Bacillus sp. V3-13]
MKKKTFTFAIAAVMSTAILIPANSPALAGQEKGQFFKTHEHEIEKKPFKQKKHSKFAWDRPGRSSPVLLPGSARAAGMVQEPIDQIDAIINKKISERAMPGAVAFVARRGHIVKYEAYGYALRYADDKFTEVDQPIQLKPDTIFDLASISKIFTTTAAMKLYEQGHFELDDPVADYLPEFAQNGKETVTIRQLMTHTSGFTAWIPLYTQGNSREDRIKIVLTHPLKNAPGSTYTYSDLNMITLGALVERLSGQRLDAFVKEHITGPLGMMDTMYNPPAKLKHRIAATEYQATPARGLVWGAVHDENAWSLDGVAGHAGVFSTARDLGAFAHMFVNEGSYGNKRILKPETVRLLAENQIPQFPGNDHGLGWEIGQGWFMDALSEGSTLGHTGYTGTSIVINQNNDTIAILLTNRVHPTRNTVSTNGARREFARQVADAIPVDIRGKEKAWFSGYGDRLERTLTARVDIEKAATLSFSTWYRIETGFDFGFVEVSEDGETWTPLREPITGSSVDWQKLNLELPENTNFVRFRYKTDSSTNGRGWYIDNVKVKEAGHRTVKPAFTGTGWQERDY